MEKPADSVEQTEKPQEAGKLRSFLTRYGMSRRALRTIQPGVHRENQTALRVSSIVCSAAILLWTITAVSQGRTYAEILLRGTALLVSLWGLWNSFHARNKTEQQEKALRIFLFTQYQCAVFFSADMGTYCGLPVVYMMLAVVLAVIFIERPWRLLLLSMEAGILYSVLELASNPAGNEGEVLLRVCCIWAASIFSTGLGIFCSTKRVNCILAEKRLDVLQQCDIATGLRNWNCLEDALCTYPGKASRMLVCICLELDSTQFIDMEQSRKEKDEAFWQIGKTIVELFGERDSYRISQDEFIIVRADTGIDVLQKKIQELKEFCENASLHIFDGYAIEAARYPDELKRTEAEAITRALIRRAENEMLRKKAELHPEYALEARLSEEELTAGEDIRRKASNLDALTGLLSSEAFYLQVQRRLHRNPDYLYDIWVVDVHNFHHFNERYGYAFGDQILKRIAVAIKNLNQEKIVGGRLFGDRFAIFKESMYYEGDSLLTILQNNIEQDEKMKGVRLRAGVNRKVDHSETASRLCDQAVFALRTIQGQVVNQVAEYTPQLNLVREKENRIIIAMEKCIQNNQLRVYFQPKHDAKTGELAGAEALVRWIHPELGYISPGLFIPIFERTGFVVESDMYMWRRVCKLQSSWLKKGLPVVPVSVNASERCFSLPDYVERVKNAMNEFSTPGELLHVEVTETIMQEKSQGLRAELNELRDCGIGIELDDFGTGFSSLNMVATMPLTTIKLDKIFVDNLKNENKAQLLTFGVQLAKAYGLMTVIEGVETEEQRKAVQEAGCDLIQGYYYSKPIPENEFEEYMQNYRNQV